MLTKVNPKECVSVSYGNHFDSMFNYYYPCILAICLYLFIIFLNKKLTETFE